MPLTQVHWISNSSEVPSCCSVLLSCMQCPTGCHDWLSDNFAIGQVVIKMDAQAAWKFIPTMNIDFCQFWGDGFQSNTRLRTCISSGGLISVKDIIMARHNKHCMHRHVYGTINNSNNNNYYDLSCPIYIICLFSQQHHSWHWNWREN